MKQKSHKNKASGKHLSSSENKFNDDNNLSNQSLKTVDDFVENCDFSSTKTRKKKRKASLTCQDEDGCSEEKKPKQKHKSNKMEGDKVNFSSGMNIEKDISEESDMEDIKQDNTPESLKKKKKHKKKKNKLNPVNIQPNTVTLDYLRKWKNDRSNWKFEKVKQIRLVSSMFDNEKLPEDYFSIFLEYMEAASKSMKELMLKHANEVVQEMEKWESLSDSEKETTPKVDENKYERARTLLQVLE